MTECRTCGNLWTSARASECPVCRRPKDPDFTTPESLRAVERTEFEKRVGETYGLPVVEES